MRESEREREREKEREREDTYNNSKISSNYTNKRLILKAVKLFNGHVGNISI